MTDKSPGLPLTVGLSSPVTNFAAINYWNHEQFSQGDIEKRTGLLRCYISRVEHGYTVPNVETLEKLARALEVPIYQLFYEGADPPKLSNFLNRKKTTGTEWGRKGEDARLLAKFSRLFSRMEASDLGMVLFMAQKMARRKAV